MSAAVRLRSFERLFFSPDQRPCFWSMKIFNKNRSRFEHFTARWRPRIDSRSISEMWYMWPGRILAYGNEHGWNVKDLSGKLTNQAAYENRREKKSKYLCDSYMFVFCTKMRREYNGAYCLCFQIRTGANRLCKNRTSVCCSLRKNLFACCTGSAEHVPASLFEFSRSWAGIIRLSVISVLCILFFSVCSYANRTLPLLVEKHEFPIIFTICLQIVELFL